MANKDRRKVLRGAEEEAFDLLAEVLTPDQWVKLLKAPLERAARQGNRGLAQKLIGAGAVVGNALHLATLGGFGEIVNDLLESGASVDAKGTSGCTPLHVAAEEGETKIFHLLLLKVADKDALNNCNETPLYLAVNGNMAAALALLVAGADVSLRRGYIKTSVVHAAAQHRFVGPS